MKKLLTCLVLLGSLFASDAFCMKKKDKETIPVIDHEGTTQYKQLLTGLNKDLSNLREKDLAIAKINRNNPAIVELIHTLCFSDTTKKNIVNCLINLKEIEQGENAVFVASLFHRITKIIAPSIIQQVSTNFEKDKKACTEAFTLNSKKLFEAKTKKNKNYITPDTAISLIIECITSFIPSLA